MGYLNDRLHGTQTQAQEARLRRPHELQSVQWLADAKLAEQVEAIQVALKKRQTEHDQALQVLQTKILKQEKIITALVTMHSNQSKA